MKTPIIPSLAPQAPSRDRRMALALGLLVVAQGLGGCDQRTVIALTLKPPLLVKIDPNLLRTLNRLDLRATTQNGREIDCENYRLLPPNDEGNPESFTANDAGDLEARLLYYPSVDEGDLELEIFAYNGSATAPTRGGKWEGRVSLKPHQVNRVTIDLRVADKVERMCPSPPLRDLGTPSDLTPPLDLNPPFDLPPPRDLTPPPDLTSPPDLTTVEVPDATTPPRDLSVIDSDASTGDLAIPDASIPSDLAATDADGKFDDALDLNASPDIGPPNGSCDDNNPCTYDVVVPTGDGGYTCMNPPPLQSGVVCRPAQGSCDIEELCDGQSPTCPPDVRQRPGSVCREETSPCDVAEVCDGNSPYCPPDAPAPACQELLIDGSFDLNLGAWELTPPQSRLTNNLVPCGRLSPPNHNILCGGPGCDAMTSQYVVLPSTKPAQLSFSLNTFSLNLPPTQTEDDFFVEVVSTQGIATIARFNSAVLPRGYRRYGPIELSAYKGSAVTLRFRAQTLNYATTFCLDDVSVLY